MSNDSMIWIFGIAMLSAVIVVVGSITSRNLPKTQMKIRIRKFGAVALALLFFGFIVNDPYVPSYSNAKYSDELRVEKLNSMEELVEFNKKQASVISDLTEDIKDLRADLYSVNRFYGNATRILLLTVVILVLNSAFIKKEEE